MSSEKVMEFNVAYFDQDKIVKGTITLDWVPMLLSRIAKHGKITFEEIK